MTTAAKKTAPKKTATRRKSAGPDVVVAIRADGRFRQLGTQVAQDGGADLVECEGGNGHQITFTTYSKCSRSPSARVTSISSTHQPF